MRADSARCADAVSGVTRESVRTREYAASRGIASPSAARPGAANVVAGQYGRVLHTGGPTQVRPHTGETPALANQVASCLLQRGYDARR